MLGGTARKPDEIVGRVPNGREVDRTFGWNRDEWQRVTGLADLGRGLPQMQPGCGLNRFFRTGSFGNGTSISGYSDVDYFASIPRDQLKAISTSTLTRLKNVLDSRFPLTGVHHRLAQLVQRSAQSTTRCSAS
jgi:hypothetical protein